MSVNRLSKKSPSQKRKTWEGRSEVRNNYNRRAGEGGNSPGQNDGKNGEELQKKILKKKIKAKVFKTKKSHWDQKKKKN